MTLPNQIDQGLCCPACGVDVRFNEARNYISCVTGEKCALGGWHAVDHFLAIHSLLAAARKPTVPRLELHGGKWTLTLPGDGIPLSQAADLIESAGKAIREVKP